MKYYIIAGEASGDLHASNLVKALNKKDKEARWRGWGGDLMQNEGVDIVRHYKETAVVGLFNVIWKLRSITRNLDACKKDVLAYQPDVLILVDYPGFNLRIAEYAKQHGIRTYYYIAPKVWASREKRIAKIKAYTDHVFTILPFEVEYFKKHQVKASYVGNPIVDAIANELDTRETRSEFIAKHGLEEKPIIALLSGSRLQEVKKILPTMVSVIDDFPDYQFVIAGVDVLGDHVYKEVLKERDVRIIYGQTYNLLRHSRAAAVASGTATLETALINTPQVVCYNVGGGKLLDWLYRAIIKVKYLSLVNLILDKLLVTELLQHQLNHENLRLELKKIVRDGSERKAILHGYQEIKEMLGDTDVSKKAAGLINAMLNEK